MPGIYVISHPKHAALWKEYRSKGTPINSSWIDDAAVYQPKFNPDVQWLLRDLELRDCSCIFIYSSCNDLPRYSLLDIGVAIGHHKNMFALGTFANIERIKDHPQFLFKPWPEWDIARTMNEAMMWDRSFKEGDTTNHGI